MNDDARNHEREDYQYQSNQVGWNSVLFWTQLAHTGGLLGTTRGLLFEKFCAWFASQAHCVPYKSSVSRTFVLTFNGKKNVMSLAPWPCLVDHSFRTVVLGCLSPAWPLKAESRINLRSVHVKFTVDEMRMGKVLSPNISLSPFSILVLFHLLYLWIINIRN
jgi:hypothetical protein